MSSKSAKSRRRLPWWRRPIDEKKLGIWGTRGGVILAIMILGALIENPWLALYIAAAAGSGLLIAIVIGRASRRGPPSLGL